MFNRKRNSIYKMDLEKWIKEELSECLNFMVPDDLVKYIMNIEDVNDLEKYLESLLNTDITKHRKFISLLMKKKKQSPSCKNATNEPKDDAELGVKDLNKRANLYLDNGQNIVTLLEGRIRCDGEARKHKLIKNCVQCGRTVCQQEGPGICPFCGHLVVTEEEQLILNNKSKNSTKLLNELIDRKCLQEPEAADSQWYRLLIFDQAEGNHSARHNSGLDWLTKDAQTELDKYEQTYTDSAGFEIITENNNDENACMISKPSTSTYDNTSQVSSDVGQSGPRMNIHPTYTGKLYKVVTEEEQLILNNKSKKSTKLLNKSIDQKLPEEWEAADSQQNELLKYDRKTNLLPKMELEKWIKAQLSQCLNFMVPDDLVKYIMSIEDVNDLEKYLESLLNTDITKHRKFISLLMKKKKQSPSCKNATNEPKDDAELGVKGLNKRANLYLDNGQNIVTLLEGRIRCDGEARKHKLIKNCVQCGRTVCQQEGPGICPFCGHLEEEEQLILNNKSKNSTKLLKELIDRKRLQESDAADSQWNRLLKYDQAEGNHRERHNSGSVRLTKDEQTELDKYEQTYTDSAGFEIITENNNDENACMISKPSTSTYDNTSQVSSDVGQSGPRMNIHPTYTGKLHKLSSFKKIHIDRPNTHLIHNDFEQLRVSQDSHLRTMTDEGVCMSMHQPWASLLVAGINTYVGTKWYTTHRGRLYIASTAQEPNAHTIRNLEKKYRELNPGLKFPKYSTGCLLGCVYLKDVLLQEEYKIQYPAGKLENPYIFVFSDPIELDLNLPIPEKPKIHKLEHHIHQAALKEATKFL